PVSVTTVTLHDLMPTETVSGRLMPARKAALHFELAGQVDERPVEPGQAVEAGDLLLSLAAGDFEDALAEAGAQLEQEAADIQRDRRLLQLSRRNYTLQKNELDRLLKLGEESLVSKSLLDETRIKLLQLEAEVARLGTSVGSAEARLALREAARNRAARNLERTRLTAPFAGTVNSVAVQAGDYVTPNQPVVELVDASALDLYVEVRGDVVQSLAQGRQVDVAIDGGVTRRGEIIALQVDPDPQTFTHALRIRLQGDGIWPGQVAQVRLPLNPLRQVTAVPSTAVLFDEGQAYVFRLNSHNLEQVPVRPGNRVGELRVIRAGIRPGDRIVTRDVAALSHGQTVQPMAAEAAPATGAPE
ncbi:MAG: efflux RND transporter periplasmic adaptor subunit, partial [Gammaproteobacteria bacterium]